MVSLLYLVAWCGHSLHEPVPPELSIFSHHKVIYALLLAPLPTPTPTPSTLHPPPMGGENTHPPTHTPSSQCKQARAEDPRRVPLLSWLALHEDYFGAATTALFRRARAQVVAATLTSGLPPIPMDVAVVPMDEQQEQQQHHHQHGEEAEAQQPPTGTDGGAAAGAAMVFPALRDAVFGIPLLVQTIAEFA